MEEQAEEQQQHKPSDDCSHGGIFSALYSPGMHKMVADPEALVLQWPLSRPEQV